MDAYKRAYDEAVLFVRQQPDTRDVILRLLKARYELAKEQMVSGQAPHHAIAQGCKSVIADLTAPDYRQPERSDDG